MARIKDEVAAIDEIKEKVLGTDNEELQLAWLVDAIDKAKGIDIMSQRLVADFGMTMEQIKEMNPPKKMSWADKIRMAMALKNVQNKERGRKNGS